MFTSGAYGACCLSLQYVVCPASLLSTRSFVCVDGNKQTKEILHVITNITFERVNSVVYFAFLIEGTLKSEVSLIIAQ